MRLNIETAGVPSPLLVEYAAISIAFEVASVLSARKVADQRFVLTERQLDSPYVKNYDALGYRPLQWAVQFDTSQWALLLARAEGRCVGGATVAFGSSQLEMLEGRSDLALLWDIRVAPDYRGRGVGRALCEGAEAWAFTCGSRELKVETQNINVPACRFYAALGFQLRVVRDDAYAPCPGESQYLWYKALRDLKAEARTIGPHSD